MTDPDEFHAGYAAALRTYLEARGEEDLAVGHELGRRALQMSISMLEIIENHFRLVDELAQSPAASTWPAALAFLSADAGPARHRDPRISRRHKALRGTAGPRRRSWPTATSSAPPW